jgi:3-oxocholest-4-en-26-oyl-CoA dehydrogenase beta subunit
VETTSAARVLAEHGTGEQRERWLPDACSGEAVLSGTVLGAPLRYADGTASGSVAQVPQGHLADALLLPADVEGELRLVLVETDAPGVARTPVELTYHSLAADVALDAVPAEPLPAAALARLDALARLGLCAQLLGVADQGVREAASYVSTREQFGRPLATFQAVSQQLGDAYCDVQAVRATLWQAAWAAENDPAGAQRAAAVAVWWATDASQRVQHVVQHVHGGIGADTTYPVHRRLLWTLRAVAQLGGPTAALAALADAL